MKYKMIQRANPLDRGKVMYCAAPVIDGNVSKAGLTKKIAAISSISGDDVSNVIESMKGVTPEYVKMGKSITIGESGTLRISFSREGVDNSDDFNVNMIKDVRYIFHAKVRNRFIEN
jgi:predicted histone-like DNA-binding protein